MMKLRKLSDPVMASNFLFLLNGLFWYMAGHVLASVLVTITGLASFAYHVFRESWFVTYAADVCLAHVSLVYTLYVAYPYMDLEHVIVLSIVLWTGLFVKKKALLSGKYDLYHTLWHVCVFLGQALLACISQER